jgi:signal transduction histidine kinase
MMSSGEETAVSRTRLIIARDLHDSVAQVLAGACFRLEAIRGWVRAGKDPDAEILAVKDALKVEQRNIRELIAKLRLGGDSVRQVDLIESLRDLTAELSRQWSIDCSLVRQREGRLSEPAWLTHEVQQLVREAVANAVRHGGTRSVSVHVSWTHEDVILSVTDRGTGFAAAGPKSNTASKRSEPRPWSIHSRITSLGGNLTVASNREGAQLTINIPRAEFR